MKQARTREPDVGLTVRHYEADPMRRTADIRETDFGATASVDPS